MNYSITGPYTPRSEMNAIEKRRAKFFGALTLIGFVVLTVVELSA